MPQGQSAECEEDLNQGSRAAGHLLSRGDARAFAEPGFGKYFGLRLHLFRQLDVGNVWKRDSPFEWDR